MLAITPEIAALLDQRRSIAKQEQEQCEYDARKAGLIFVPSQGKAMTQAEYDAWHYNLDA